MPRTCFALSTPADRLRSSRVAEPTIWMRFAEDLASQGLAALMGATAGARLAFYFERRRAQEDQRRSDRREEKRESDREALAGNMALFTLSRMYNAQLNFWRQRMEPWRDDPLLWYLMPPGGEPPLEGIGFDYTALAFLLKSDAPGIMLSLDKLADQYRTLADTVRRRSQMHEQDVTPRLESYFMPPGTPMENVEQLLERRVVAAMTGYIDDIRTFLYTSLQELPTVAQGLHDLLQKRMPGENFIWFPRATDSQGNPIP